MLSFKQFITEARSRPFLKWWYNSKTRKVVKVDFPLHLQQVVATPKPFGLTEKDVFTPASTGPKREAKNFQIEQRLKEAGWVDVTWSIRIKRLTIRGLNNTISKKALKWFIDKIEVPDKVEIVNGVGTSHAAFPLEGSQIDAFAKTGTVIKLTDIGATMARFR